MFKKNQTMAHGNTGGETIIAQGVKVEGDFNSDGDVVIDGEVIGSVKTTRSLTIGQAARIHANVVANTVLIAGEVKGDIEAVERLELTSTSKVKGDIVTALISVAEGAKLNGKISMGGQGSGKGKAKKSETSDVEVVSEVVE
jgi:cytoskeletal protein CcmA (bactofilin family)